MDMLSDIGKAGKFMNEYFVAFHVARENFSIKACYPHEPVSWNPSNKPVLFPFRIYARYADCVGKGRQRVV